MKHILVLFALLFATASYAEDFNTSQHNFKVKHRLFDIERRETLNSDSDHLQIGVNLTEATSLQLRFIDREEKERRLRLTHTFKGEHWYIKPRIEFRNFQGDSVDYWRFRPIFGVTAKKDLFKVYAEVQPTFNLNRDDGTDDAKIDSSQSKLGVDYNITPKVKIGAFIQSEFDSSFKRKNAFIGTGLSYSF